MKNKIIAMKEQFPRPQAPESTAHRAAEGLARIFAMLLAAGAAPSFASLITAPQGPLEEQPTAGLTTGMAPLASLDLSQDAQTPYPLFSGWSPNLSTDFTASIFAPEAYVGAYKVSLDQISTADMPGQSTPMLALLNSIPSAWHIPLGNVLAQAQLDFVLYMDVDQHAASPLASYKASYEILQQLAIAKSLTPTALQDQLCGPHQGLIERIANFSGITPEQAKWLMYSAVWQDPKTERADLDSLWRQLEELRCDKPALSPEDYAKVRQAVLDLKLAYVNELIHLLKGNKDTLSQLISQHQDNPIFSRLRDWINNNPGKELTFNQLPLVLDLLCSQISRHPKGPMGRQIVPLPPSTEKPTTPPPAIPERPYEHGFETPPIVVPPTQHYNIPWQTPYDIPWQQPRPEEGIPWTTPNQSAVPLLGTAWYLGAGLLGFGAFARRGAGGAGTTGPE